MYLTVGDFSGMKFCDGFVAIGLVIRDVPPIRWLWVDLRPGMTVLYGVSGVGKTTLLRAIADALSGVRPEAGGSVTLHLAPIVDSPIGLGEDIVSRLGRLRSSLLGRDQLFDFTEDAEESELPVEPSSTAHLLELVAGVILGSAAGLYHSHRVTLDAVGTTDEPGWRVGVSGIPHSIVDAAAHHRFIVDSRHPQGEQPTDMAAAYRSISAAERHAPILRECLGQQVGDDWPELAASVQLAVQPPEDDEWPGSEDGPVWAGRRGRTCYRADDRIDIQTQTLELLLLVTGRKDGAPDLISVAMNDEFVPSDRLSRVAEVLTQRASRQLSDLTGQQLRLELKLHEPNRWPEHGLAEWIAVDPWGRAGPIDQLGSGLHRWACLAISLVLAGSGRSEATDVVIDEPERGLHTAAQLSAASTIERLCETDVSDTNVFVASHSPAFLGLPNAHVVRLDRDSGGHVVARPLELWGSVDSVAAELGITRADLLLASRWIILVEGEHDAAVLRALFSAQLSRSRAQIVTMGGADNAKLNVASGLLTFSSCRVRLVLDGLSVGHHAAWSEAVDLDRGGHAKQAKSVLQKMQDDRQREVQMLAQAGLEALKLHQLERIELVGLSEPDIVNYLPVSFFVPDALSWDALYNEYRLAVPSDRRANVRFKTWVSENRAKTRINRDSIAAAARTLIGDPPAELAAIVEAL